MTTTTADYEVVDLAPWLFPGQGVDPYLLPTITVEGPVNGLWTITAPDEFTVEQLDAAILLQKNANSAQSNFDILRSKAQTALSVNATFLAIASPTNAQVVAQVKALTRQNNALIRLQIGDLSSTTGT